MKIDDIQSFPVRPLLQPAIEQLAPNEVVSVYLDATGAGDRYGQADPALTASAATGKLHDPRDEPVIQAIRQE